MPLEATALVEAAAQATGAVFSDLPYCPSLTEYRRRRARVVHIGDVPLGGDYPIRVQSMTTVDTMDTLGSVEETLRMVAAGCEYVRITAPSLKEAQNLAEIKFCTKYIYKSQYLHNLYCYRFRY